MDPIIRASLGFVWDGFNGDTADARCPHLAQKKPGSAGLTGATNGGHLAAQRSGPWHMNPQGFPLLAYAL